MNSRPACGENIARAGGRAVDWPEYGAKAGNIVLQMMIKMPVPLAYNSCLNC